MGARPSEQRPMLEDLRSQRQFCTKVVDALFEYDERSVLEYALASIESFETLMERREKQYKQIKAQRGARNPGVRSRTRTGRPRRSNASRLR